LTTDKRIVGEEYLRSLLHARLCNQPGFEAVKEIEITYQNGGIANWSADLVPMLGQKISGDLKRALIKDKLEFQRRFELETDD
jgi:hypothetical protein